MPWISGLDCLRLDHRIEVQVSLKSSETWLKSGLFAFRRGGVKDHSLLNSEIFMYILSTVRGVKCYVFAYTSR